MSILSFLFVFFIYTSCMVSVFFFSSRRRHTRWTGDWSSDVCSSDLHGRPLLDLPGHDRERAPQAPDRVPEVSDMIIPTVIETTGHCERAYDIYSRLLRNRIVFVGRAIDDAVANTVVAQLLFLQSEAPEKDISLYINSP